MAGYNQIKPRLPFELIDFDPLYFVAHFCTLVELG